MRVISKARLREFWQALSHRDSEGPLKAWHTHVSNTTVAWRNWGDVNRDFATVSLVGNCVVFNIAGNKYRLITRVLYPSHKVLILQVLTHVEYDRNKWQARCGCFDPPPAKARKLTTAIQFRTKRK